MKNKLSPYGFVKNLIFQRNAYLRNDLQNGTYNILTLLIAYANQDGITVHFSIDKVAQKRNVRRQAIQNQIKKLEHAGYINRDIRPGQTNRYILNFALVDIDATELDCGTFLKGATELDCGTATNIVAFNATQSSCSKRSLENNKKNATTCDWRQKIKSEIGDAPYSSWVKDLVYNEENNELIADSKLKAEWVYNNYLQTIRQHLPNVDRIVVSSMSLNRK